MKEKSERARRNAFGNLYRKNGEKTKDNKNDEERNF